MPKIHPTLRSRAVPLEELTPLERNPRLGDLASIRESLREHGQYQPIVARKDSGEILAGNHRYYAAEAEGWKSIAVVYVDVDDETAKRIALVDNRTGDTAEYDNEILAELLSDLSETETGLLGTWYSDGDLAELLSDIEIPDFEPIMGQAIPRLDESDPPKVKCPSCEEIFKIAGNSV